MACCVLTAVVMHQLIKICDALDIHFLKIQYNEPEHNEDDTCATGNPEESSSCTTTRISISGMTCAACTASITSELENLPGVIRANVSLPLARATVSHYSSLVSAEQLLESIQSVGYEASLGNRTSEEILEHLQQSSELQGLRASISSASICSTIILAFRYIPFASTQLMPTLLSLLLTLKVQIYDAWSIHHAAWSGAGLLSATMNTLLSLSLLLGIALVIFRLLVDGSQSALEYMPSGTLLALVTLAGRYLEAVLRREGNANLAALYELQSGREAYQLAEDKTTLPACLLAKGDDILIPAHTVIPCDCYIVSGRSAIDESTITGESLPVTKDIGDFLSAGSKNLSRQVRVVVCEAQDSSSLAKMIEGISTATEQRLEGRQPLEYIMRAFVVSVVSLAASALLLTIWYYRHLGLLECLTVGCERAMTILAAACPCGIGLATPSAAIAGVHAAFKQGVLVRGGIRTMEALTKVTHVVLDKTGTLTEGRLSVVSHQFHDTARLNERLCYRLLAAAEAEEARFHPVAKAVFKWALQQSNVSSETKHSILETRNLQQVLGKGVSCEVRGHSSEWYSVTVGTITFLRENGILNIPDGSQIDQAASCVHFAFNKQYSGLLELHDSVRDEASYVIQHLLENNLNVTMLTGDAAAEAERISSLLQIPVLASRSLPAEKMDHIENLQREGHRVVMIGDGINDSLAQAKANVGISLSLGQGLSAGASDVVITSNNLCSLLSLFDISKRVTAQAHINTVWALVYNVIAISLALGFFEPWGFKISPSTAGSMMAFSSISVLSMSLYLRHRLQNESVKP